MKRVISTLRNAFFYMTAIFTAVICIFMLVFLAQGTGTNQGLNVEVFKSSLIFAAISGACIATVGAFEKLPAIFRYIIDFILSYAAFFLWFRMLAATAANILPSHFFTLSTVYVVIFAVVACFAALMKKLSGRKTDTAEDEK